MPPSVMSVDTPMDLSTKARRKLRLEEFLRQNLDQAPAAHVIQWVNREQGVFRILWTHQSSGAFTHQDAALFRYWALARGKPANLSSVELKQSLRMALNKSPSVERLAVTNDEYRYFKFTDWTSRRKNISGVKSMKGQHETTRKRSPLPRHPPPLVPISYKHSSSPPISISDDHINPKGEEKSVMPFNEELLRKLLESRSRSSQFPRECHYAEEGADKHLGHSHFLSEHTVLGHIFPQHLIPKSHFTEDSIQKLSPPYRHYSKDQRTLDYTIREEALHDPLSLNDNNLLVEHLKYFSKAHSPQGYSEPQHTVPSYKESLTRPDMDSAISLYSDNPFYPAYHHYDYRSTAPTSLYTIPDQALATPPEVFESRLINMQ